MTRNSIFPGGFRMGNSRNRQRKSQRVMPNGGKAGQKRALMTPEMVANLQTSYKHGSTVVDTPFPTKDAEWKATQRARAGLPRSPHKRCRVMQNLCEDEASALFVQAFQGADPRELKALKLLAENIRQVMSAHNASRTKNEVRHMRKLVAALVGSKLTRSQRLVTETAKLCGIDRRTLVEGLALRDRLLADDINAIFAVEVHAHLLLSNSLVIDRDMPVLPIG